MPTKKSPITSHAKKRSQVSIGKPAMSSTQNITTPASHLARTTSVSVTGTVKSVSIVPVRRSSAISLMVSAGMATNSAIQNGALAEM